MGALNIVSDERLKKLHAHLSLLESGKIYRVIRQHKVGYDEMLIIFDRFVGNKFFYKIIASKLGDGMDWLLRVRDPHYMFHDNFIHMNGDGIKFTHIEPIEVTDLPVYVSWGFKTSLFEGLLNGA